MKPQSPKGKIVRRFNKALIQVIAISLLVHVIGLFILGSVVIFQNLQVEEAEFEAPQLPIESIEPQRIEVRLNKLQKKSKPPRARISVMNPSQINVPNLDLDLPDINDNAYVGGFGRGHGMTGGSFDLGKMAVDFFGISDDAERVAFVVDYSLSMNREVEKGVSRFTLMKQELVRSISSLPSSTMVATIFFSGPVWRPHESGEKALEKYDYKEGEWHSFKLKPGEEVPTPTWRVHNTANRDKLISQVRRNKMTGGTTWGEPLSVIFATHPAPEAIFFLTDGATSEEDVKRSLKMVSDFRKENPDVKIHTIALGEPKAENGLRRISSMTGGKFRLVTKSEEVRGSG